MSTIETFCNGIVTRSQRDGWLEVIVPIVAPIITQLIAQCFKNGPQMQQALQQITFAQRVVIMRTAKQITTDAGIPILRGRARATAAVAEAIEAEIRAAQQLDAGPSVWQAAFDEAVCYAS